MLMKRLFDTAAAAVLILLLSPVMLLVGALVLARLGRPVLFVQERPGLHMIPFRMLKFRTMSDERDDRGEPLPDQLRLTPFGSVLRRLSLDELPQLFNVLKGDMSLVGPRPLLTRYLPYYSERERLRFRVRPGITGLAQISGRNDLPWPERLSLDADYVERRSFLLDLRILLLTGWKVLKRDHVALYPSLSGSDLDLERGG